MHWGAYHFLRPGDMVEQAHFFLNTAQIDPASTLLAADHEDDRVSIDDLLVWLDTVEELVGIRPAIYSGHVLKAQLASGAHSIVNGDRYRLWIAQYGPEAELPAGFESYWLWQWTDRGTVPGVNPPTDLNDYQGTDEELAAEWLGAIKPPPAPVEPEIPPELVTTTLTPEGFQRALAEAGYYKGEIDGESGPMTRRAVDQWFADGETITVEEEG